MTGKKRNSLVKRSKKTRIVLATDQMYVTLKDLDQAIAKVVREESSKNSGDGRTDQEQSPNEAGEELEALKNRVDGLEAAVLALIEESQGHIRKMSGKIDVLERTVYQLGRVVIARVDGNGGFWYADDFVRSRDDA